MSDESWKTVTMPEAVYCRLKECERQLAEYKARAERAEQERDHAAANWIQPGDIVFRPTGEKRRCRQGDLIELDGEIVRGEDDYDDTYTIYTRIEFPAPPLDSPASVHSDYQSAGNPKEPAATIKESLTVQPAAAVEWIARDVKCPHESLTKWAVVPTKRVRKQDVEAAAKKIAGYDALISACIIARSFINELRVPQDHWQATTQISRGGRVIDALNKVLAAQLEASTPNQEGG